MPSKFDLGLVMAGAISAGSYTAGVIDFMLLALEEWEKEKSLDKNRNEKNFPHHQVKLKVLAGSSAGGMTAALMAARIARSRGQDDDVIHDSWVNEIDAEKLLTTTDLDGPTARSFLNGDIIPGIAAKALDEDARPAGLDPKAAFPPYFNDPLDLVLTVSNLRGIPFGSTFSGGRYEMLTHGDWFHFVLGMKKPDPWPPTQGSFHPSDLPPGPDWLPPETFNDPAWERFKRVAVATGAFPLALPSQRLDWHGVDGYTALVRSLVATGGTAAKHLPIKPAFPKNPFKTYPFDAVDGGMVNNEPVDLARRALDLKLYDPNHRKGEAAVLLVDPFPNTGVFESADPPETPSMLQTARSILKALQNQARFQPEELAQARNPSVDTQFMITPERKGRELAADPERWLNIACGSLGGFGGFLHPSYRIHDYQLGRRNCQRFLQKRFTLNGKNWGDTRDGEQKGEQRASLFDDWNPPEGDPVWAQMRDENDVVIPGAEAVALPIIPLFGKAKEPQEMKEPWPDRKFTAADKEKLEKRLEIRIRALARGFGMNKLAVALAVPILAPWAADALIDKLLGQLRANDLYPK